MIEDERTLSTLSVSAAGRYLGIGRNASYEAVKRGQLPVIRIGSRLRVPVVALERMLENAVPRADDNLLKPEDLG
jgi:excisionase family DNA binding protein